MTHHSTVHIQLNAMFPMPQGPREAHQPSNYDDAHTVVRNSETMHSRRSAMTTGIHQQAVHCSPTGSGSATSPMIRTSHRLTPYMRTGPVCADKHTAVVPCGSHPTGLGWLDQGGISVADAPVRRVMPPSLFEPVW